MISSGGAIRSIAQIENLHFGWRRYAGDSNVALRVRLAPCPAASIPSTATGRNADMICCWLARNLAIAYQRWGLRSLGVNFTQRL